MPLIYGKTLISINNDIRLAFQGYLSSKECMQLSKYCHFFFENKFPDIVHLMKFISKMAWFCSAVNKPVVYSTDYYLSLQDYLCSTTENIQIYNRLTKKRRRVTLRIPTSKKDKRKTQVSTFANFIHQKDAFIAMRVIHTLLWNKAPLYTVHDNFLTILPFVVYTPFVYLSIFDQLRSPIEFINLFILWNLIPINVCYSHNNETDPINEIASTDKLLSLLKEEIQGPIHWIQNPIPIAHLKCMLEFHIPKDISPSERKKLVSKIDDILQYYETYLSNVCGCDTKNVIKKRGN